MTAPPLSDGLDPPLSWPNRGGNWSRFQTDTCGRGLRKKLYKKIHKKEIYIRSNQSTLQVSYQKCVIKPALIWTISDSPFHIKFDGYQSNISRTGKGNSVLSLMHCHFKILSFLVGRNVHSLCGSRYATDGRPRTLHQRPKGPTALRDVGQKWRPGMRECLCLIYERSYV